MAWGCARVCASWPHMASLVCAHEGTSSHQWVSSLRCPRASQRRVRFPSSKCCLCLPPLSGQPTPPLALPAFMQGASTNTALTPTVLYRHCRVQSSYTPSASMVPRVSSVMVSDPAGTPGKLTIALLPAAFRVILRF